MGGKLRQYFAALTATIGAYVTGSWISWTSSAEEPLTKNEYMGFPVSVDEFNIIAAILMIGGFFSNIILLFTLDKIGRKWLLLSLSVPFAIGWILIILAKNVLMLYLGRFIGGFGIGVFAVVSSLYITEVSEKDIRGKLTSFYTLMFVAGMLHCYVLGAFVSLNVISSSSLVITVIFFILFSFQPESPATYVMRKDIDNAKKSLAYFRASNYDVMPELDQMIQRESVRESNPPTFRRLLTLPARKALILSLTMQFFQQITGIVGILFFQKSIFEASSIPMSSDAATIVVGGVHLVFTFISSMTVDHLGRKFLLVTSFSVLTLTCAVLSYYYAFQDTLQYCCSLIPIFALCVFRAIYALGPGPIPWVILAECVSEEMKGLVGPLTGAFVNLISASAALYFNQLIGWIGISSAFVCFSVGSFIAVIFVIFYVPETKRKSIDEIQKILLGKKNKENVI